MPVYPFRCPDCQEYVEVFRHMKDSGDVEVCKCGQRMDRIFTVPQVSVPQNSGYFDVGLGQYIHHKSDAKGAMQKINDETGMEVEPVGNDYVKPKKPHIDYDLPRGILDDIPGD